MMHTECHECTGLDKGAHGSLADTTCSTCNDHTFALQMARVEGGIGRDGHTLVELRVWGHICGSSLGDNVYPEGE